MNEQLVGHNSVSRIESSAPLAQRGRATPDRLSIGPSLGALDARFFARPAEEVAPELIGVTLLLGGVGGRIVEVEAYDEREPASHGFRGPTPRTRSLFGRPARAYVYRSYGLHWCLNLVCGRDGQGAGILVRALEPTHGLEQMRARRGVDDLHLLCAGPGRVGQALGVTHAYDGHRLDAAPFALLPRLEATEIQTGPRIGVTKAADLPWRFTDARSGFLSRPSGRRAGTGVRAGVH